MNKRVYLLGAVIAVVCGLMLLPQRGAAQAIPPELGQGWLPEFTLTSRQLLQLADATPGEKFAWRPGPGVRSVSEVYMHIAAGNYWLLQQAGALQIFVHSAGIGIEKPFLATRDDEWARVIGIDLTGTFFCLRAVGRVMAAARYDDRRPP